jgi:hypothetical protein
MEKIMRLIRLAGVAALSLIVIVIWMLVTSRRFEPVAPGNLPGGFNGRVMAMEFVDSVPAVSVILGPNYAHNSEVMRDEMVIDYIFIGGYALLYVTVGLLLKRRYCLWASYLAGVAIVSGIAAAMFDVVENRAILNILDTPEITQAMVNAVRDASLVKWTLNCTAMAILAIAFYGVSKIASWIGYAFSLTAIVGLAGLWHHTWLGLFGIPLLLGLALLSVVSIFWPKELKDNFGCS